MSGAEISPAARAFDTIAGIFDARFTPWLSVAAQRRAVRTALARAFPRGSRLLEVGGGTGDDAAWLLDHGRSVLMTDAGPAMTQVASAKLARFPDARVETVQAEEMEAFAARLTTEGVGKFDGVYSNFAGLNCVTDLSPFARGLASLVRPGGQALLVIFGTFSPGEMITECLRGRPQNALRRLKKGDVPARLSGQHFTVRYHRRADLARAMAPWFSLVETRAIGLFVPPSAAEPWISNYPRLIGLFEALDKILARPLAIFGDHILYRLVRTDEPAPPAAQP